MAKQELSATSVETISALVDNEVSELELRRLLKQIDQEPEIAQVWSRYQLVGASLRGETPLLAPKSFASAISEAIANEPALTPEQDAHLASSDRVTDKSKRFKTLWQNVSRVAIAASVAGAVVVGVQHYGIDDQANLAAPLAAIEAPKSLQAELPSGINVPALSARTVAVQSGYNSRPQESRRVMFVPHQQAAPIYNEDVSIYVNGLIEEHSGNAAATTHQGMLPFTRIILIDDE